MYIYHALCHQKCFLRHLYFSTFLSVRSLFNKSKTRKSVKEGVQNMNMFLNNNPERCLPHFKSASSLLDEDDLVSDGLVPLDLQLHVMVVLKQKKPSQTGLPFNSDIKH